MIGIYKITSPTGRVYIGQSIRLEDRKAEYSKLKCRNQVRLYSSLVKYGFSEHIFEVVEECILEDLNVRERYWQDFYEVLSKKGLNCKLTVTGSRRGKLSEETKRRIGEGSRGMKYNMRGDVVRKVRVAKKDCRGCTGIKFSEEAKKSMSRAQKEYWANKSRRIYSEEEAKERAREYQKEYRKKLK